jgi:heme-degrading monooxygenase HmoA
MYIRFVNSQVNLETIDEAIQIWDEQLKPVLKGIKGYKSGYLTGDRKSGKSVAVSIWETEADAIAFNTSGKYAELIALFARHMVAPPTQEQFEVFVEV